MPTVAELALPRSKDELLEQNLNSMAAKGLGSRGWGAKHPPRVQAEVDAEVLSALYDMAVLVINGGFPDSAASADPAVQNPWLDLCLAGFFQELRNPPSPATIQLRLTSTQGNGPFQLAPGRIAVFGPTLDEPLYYRSIESSSVPANDGVNGLLGVDVRFQAERDGAVYNVQPGTITQLKTPLPGLVVTSPAIGATGSIIITPGSDGESDQQYLARAKAKWGTLGRGWMVNTIVFLVLTNFPSVTRILVRDPGGLPAQVDIYIGDSDGGVPDATVQSVYDYLADKIRRPSGNKPPRVFSAVARVIAFTGTLYTDGTNTAAIAEALERIASFQGTLSIGQKVYRSRLDDVIVDVPSGTVACNLSVSGDINPAFNEAIVFIPTLTVEIVDSI